MKITRSTKFAILVLIIFLSTSVALASTGTIDSTFKYAWGENLGWINFAPRDASNNYIGLTVTDSAITGYAWSPLYGWINFNPGNSGQGVTNSTSGTLGGQAWSQQLGWIDMTGVSINSSGVFTGTAGTAGTSAGRINFGCSNCNVTTSWRPSSSGSSSSSGGTSGGTGYISNVANIINNIFNNVDIKTKDGQTGATVDSTNPGKNTNTGINNGSNNTSINTDVKSDTGNPTQKTSWYKGVVEFVKKEGIIKPLIVISLTIIGFLLMFLS